MARAPSSRAARPRSKLGREPRAPRRPRAPDAVTRYARSVVAGRVVAGKLVRQACQRHLDDLRDGPARGLRFDRERAWRAISFFRTLKHVEGERAGEYIELEHWQEFIVGSLMGWLRRDEPDAGGRRRGDGWRRRFKVAYLEISKKQGKSTMVAGLALLLTFFDGEIGAKGYAAATTRDQAKLVHGAASTMALQCYRRRLRPFKYVISDPLTNSSFTCVGARENSLDGLNASFVVLDELHLHPTPAVLEVMRRGQRARRQPMCVMITTAGWNRNSVCWRERELARKILDPEHGYDDDEEFAYIATLDEGDDYHDERVWPKAMPNLGVSVQADVVRADVRKADAEPEELPPMLQKIFNLWVSNSIDRPIDMALWDAAECAATIDLEELRGRPCYGAIDVARVGDLSSFSLVFPPVDEGELVKALGWHFIPDDDVVQRAKRDQVPYVKWRDAGAIIATPGNITDTKVIRETVLAQVKRFRIQQIAYDPTFAGDLAQDLAAAGLTLVQHFQNYSAMSLPCAELLSLVKSKRLQHGGDVVLRWAVDNLVMRSGPSKRLLPDKERSREKIDPAVALIMAVGRAALAPPPQPRGRIRTLTL